MLLESRDTRVFEINNSTGLDHSIGDNADNWVWAVTGVYLLSFLMVTGLGFRAPYGEKIFHYLFTISLVVGAISYFTAASNLGWVGVESIHFAPGIRQIYFSKYINWFIGWTPIIAALGIISGASWATIVYNVCLMWAWIGSWLSGAMVPSVYRWAYFAFGSFVYFLLAISLLLGAGAAKKHGLAKPYLIVCGWLVALWLPYNIAWALDDGGNVYSVSRAWIFWGILDLATVPLLCFAVLFFARSWDPKEYNIRFTSHGEEEAEDEKRIHAFPNTMHKQSPRSDLGEDESVV